MKDTWTHLRDSTDSIVLSTDRKQFGFDKHSGKISQISIHDGVAWRELLSDDRHAGDSWELPVRKFSEVVSEPDSVVFEVDRGNDEWSFVTRYECYASGYLVVDIDVQAIANDVVPQPLRVDIPVDRETVLANFHRVVNLENDPNNRLYIRALGLDFSTDERPVTGSMNLLLEQPLRGLQGRPTQKFFHDDEEGASLGYSLSNARNAPVSAGFRYRNRYGLSVTTLDTSESPVRGQRIYHWYGRFPRYPSDDLITQCAEYGCSIFILHMPSFRHITGSHPAEPAEMRRVVDACHGYGMKVMCYCVPQLISRNSPEFPDLASSRTENTATWDSLKQTQIVFYEQDASYDCDELCLGSEAAFRFGRDTVLACVAEYGLDGIYVDFAWPAAGLCMHEDHGHESGHFSFASYWRMLREWREALGDDALMIGHGGGLLVSSDFVEGFDACLTGEAQGDLDPVMIGQHIGAAPMLWPMHRRKQEMFRSARTIPSLVREAMTPHTGLGVMGTSIIATLDAAHHGELLPLWQIWRGFPMERARVYTYLNAEGIEVDNSEVAWSLYATDDPAWLLILSNAGGPYHDSHPAVGVAATIPSAIIATNSPLRTWRLEGASYETFRVREIDPTKNRTITVPEIMVHETIGIVLSPGEPPRELTSLIDHLAGRWERLGPIYGDRLARMKWVDEQRAQWAKLPNAATAGASYDEFMKNRIAE